MSPCGMSGNEDIVRINTVVGGILVDPGKGARHILNLSGMFGPWVEPVID